MIHVLPGMGADNRMYAGAWRALPECVFLDWPVYRGEETLADVARRVTDEAGIEDGDVLIGSSLGGMVACEIAKLRAVKALVLVGSAKNSEEVGAPLRALRAVVGLAPIAFAQFAAGKFPGELAQMFGRSQPGFIRAMCRAIFTWEGLDERIVSPLRIHGRKDRLIPLPAAGVDQIVEGGHLIAMTHAEKCVEFVRARLKCSG